MWVYTILEAFGDFRITITLTFSATITIIWKPDANFATSFTGKVKIHIAIVTAVIMIDQ